METDSDSCDISVNIHMNTHFCNDHSTTVIKDTYSNFGIRSLTTTASDTLTHNYPCYDQVFPVPLLRKPEACARKQVLLTKRAQHL